MSFHCFSVSFLEIIDIFIQGIAVSRGVHGQDQRISEVSQHFSVISAYCLGKLSVKIPFVINIFLICVDYFSLFSFWLDYQYLPSSVTLFLRIIFVYCQSESECDILLCFAYLKTPVDVVVHSMKCFASWVIEWVRCEGPAQIVEVSHVHTWYSSNYDERGLITSWTKEWQAVGERKYV